MSGSTMSGTIMWDLHRQAAQEAAVAAAAAPAAELDAETGLSGGRRGLSGGGSAEDFGYNCIRVRKKGWLVEGQNAVYQAGAAGNIKHLCPNSEKSCVPGRSGGSQYFCPDSDDPLKISNCIRTRFFPVWCYPRINLPIVCAVGGTRCACSCGRPSFGFEFARGRGIGDNVFSAVSFAIPVVSV